jgi:hypothetical protein
MSAARLYAVLQMDGIKLLLPQNEVVILESSTDVQQGWIAFRGGEWPVYCLDAGFVPSLEPPPTRRICALLAHDEGFQGLLCDTLEQLPGERLTLHPLPRCMQQPDTLVTGLALQGEQVLYLTSSAQLARFMGAAL